MAFRHFTFHLHRLIDAKGQYNDNSSFLVNYSINSLDAYRTANKSQSVNHW